MKLLNFNIIKLTVCLIIGILIGHRFPIEIYLSITILFTCLFGVMMSYLLGKGRTKKSIIFGVFTFSTMIMLGILSFQLTDVKYQSKHYSHQDLRFKDPHTVVLQIKERLKPDSYNDKYIAEIISMDSMSVTGKLLLNIAKDSTQQQPLKVGTNYLSHITLTGVKKPINPYQFDYNAYLKRRQIHHQAFSEPKMFYALKNEEYSLRALSAQFRIHVNQSLIDSGFKSEALAIINALLLGQRQDIDPTTYTNYVNAGVIHILAVSGLHVGIILLLLDYLMRPLLYLPKGRYAKMLLIVLILWLFAIIAGLSPSVTRAVTMFSILAVAMHLKRPTNSYNTLAISAFFILLFKPLYLFEVGFQMSYLAVLGIISFQPIFYKLWRPRFWATDKLWQTFTVTLAAQLGVVPISLYYFNQFPGLFFISNLVIIPFLGLLLGFGLLCIVLASFDATPKILVVAFSFLIDTLNDFIAWIAQFDQFLFRYISFSASHVIVCYLGIVGLFWFLNQKSYPAVRLILISFLVFIGVNIWINYETSQTELIVFNKNRQTLIGLKDANALQLFSNMNDSLLRKDKMIENYTVGAFVKSTTIDTLSNVYQFQKQMVLLIDSSGVYNVSFKPDIVIITNSPKLNLNRLIETINPKEIVADASNYTSYVARWKITCEAKKIPFHSTYEKGAYILK